MHKSCTAWTSLYIYIVVEDCQVAFSSCDSEAPCMLCGVPTRLPLPSNLKRVPLRESLFHAVSYGSPSSLFLGRSRDCWRGLGQSQTNKAMKHMWRSSNHMVYPIILQLLPPLERKLHPPTAPTPWTAKLAGPLCLCPAPFIDQGACDQNRETRSPPRTATHRDAPRRTTQHATRTE